MEEAAAATPVVDDDDVGSCHDHDLASDNHVQAHQLLGQRGAPADCGIDPEVWLLRFSVDNC